MKDTLKSKNLWGTIGVVMTFQIIALEQFLPHINQYLPTEYAFVGTVILPSVIILAKILRDQGILTRYLMSMGYVASDSADTDVQAQGTVKEVVKAEAKKVAKNKVVKKVNDGLDKVIEKL